MPVMSGKTALLALMKQEGVRFLFGNPGTTELPLMDALAVETELRYVLALQEAAVMAMADGYAQASGELTAVNLHVAPGLGNAMGMLYDAQKAGSPLLVTAGQHDQTFNLTEPILWADLPTIARPLVKWAYEPRSLADLPRAVHRAAKVALSPPTGPVFLSLPADVLKSEADIELGAPNRVAPRLRGDATAIDRAVALLARAETPLIIAGDAVAQADALAELVAFAETLGAPVYDEGVPSRASFPTTHPLYRGGMARLAPLIRSTLQQHDVVVSIGGDLFTLSLPSEIDPMPEGLKVIHVDTDAWELGKNHPETVPILGDPKAVLPELTAALERQLIGAAKERCRTRSLHFQGEIAAEVAALKDRAAALADQEPIQPLALLHALAEALPDDAIVVDESISSGAGLRRLLRSRDSASFFGLRGGGIGWGLPAAIGVKLARPSRPVIALIGDGSAMYTCQALWTAAHERLQVVFVILNNASYRILKQRTNALKGFAAQTDTYVGMELTEPRLDFVSLARALGLDGCRLQKLGDLAGVLAPALSSTGSTLIDVELDRSYKPL